MQICCCNTTRCNKSGFAELQGISGDQNISDGPEYRRRMNSGNRQWSRGTGRRISWKALVGFMSGIVLIAGIVGSAVLFIRSRSHGISGISFRPRFFKGASELEQAFDENDDSSGELCAAASALKDNCVLHIDRTATRVPPRLTEKEKQALLLSMKRHEKIKKVARSKKPPTIIKVVTFATTDDITVSERSASMREAGEKSTHLRKSRKVGLLQRMIFNGPKQFQFDFDELANLLERGAEIFLKEPSLVEVPVPCMVYGDIHGQYSDLHRWFNLNGWPWKSRSVFLGDFVDRGSHGIEVVALITALKIEFPDKVFVCRGNHEEESLNRAYSFHNEVVMRFADIKDIFDGKDGMAMYTYFKSLFNSLPLAVLIGGRILGMHGGISPHLTSLQAIRNIERPLDDFDVGTLACDLVWSDPDTNPKRSGFRANFEREPVNGIGQLFASDTVKKTCERLGIDMIIRGHQAPMHGYALFSEGHLLTLFSAPGYKGISESDINMGASLEISSSMNITVKQIHVTEKFRQKRITDAEEKRKMRKTRICTPGCV